VEEDLQVRLNSLSRAIDNARAVSTSWQADPSKGEDAELDSVAPPPDLAELYPVFVIFLMLAAMAATSIAGFVSRGYVADLISGTPEYVCVASASKAEPTLRWSSFRRLRADGSEFNGYWVGTLIETQGMNCIENGDAISFAMLPLSGGTDLSLTRFEGREVLAESRQWGQWMDLTNETGTERWRNDGEGYRKISP
jgi:hypothetical protein